MINIPEIREGESRKNYVARCIPYVVEHEGLTQEQAVGKCEGLYNEHEKKEKSSLDNEEITGQLEFKGSGIVKINNDLLKLEAIICKEEVFYDGIFITSGVFKNSVESWANKPVDLEHNSELKNDKSYIIGYVGKTIWNEQDKTISAEIFINRKSQRYEEFKQLYDKIIGQNRPLNVSVFGNATYKRIKTKDGTIHTLSSFQPTSLAVCEVGKCDEDLGCKVTTEKIIASNKSNDERKKYLEDRIRKMERYK